MSEQASGLRIVYFGTPEFAAYIMQFLVEHGEQIVAAVTTPDKAQGRGMKIRKSAVSELAAKLGIPVLTPTKHKDPEFLDSLGAFEADLFVVVAYKILPKEVFAMPRFGTFNVHASLLPRYRGAAPINWAILRGDTETGITTFLLDDKIDTGQLLLREQVEIGPEETAGELHDRLMTLGAQLALQTIRGLVKGTLIPRPQVNSEATTAPKIFPADCVINFNNPADHVHNVIRGLSPYPGAVTMYYSLAVDQPVRLKLLRSVIASDAELRFAGQPLEAGMFKREGERLFVGTSTDPVEILEIQKEGKRAMTTSELLRGNSELFE